MGTLLRYPYEVRDEKEYFDDIQDVKVTKDMLDLAKHIVNQKTADFEPEKFEDHYEDALTELINAKRNGKTVGAKPRQAARTSWTSWMHSRRALPAKGLRRKARSPRKAAASQKEMLLPISNKRAAKEDKKADKRATTSRTRKSA